MKHIVYLFLFVCLVSQAQDKYLTKTGALNFEASVPSFEEVAATNNSVTAIIDIKTNELAVLVLVKGFRFKNALMEEHFNENYAESNLYPKATFNGSISGDSLLHKTSGNYEIEGELTFHGITKEIQNIPVKISFENNVIKLEGVFIVKASDYGIKIPNIVKNKVSDRVKVQFNFHLAKN